MHKIAVRFEIAKLLKEAGYPQNKSVLYWEEHVGGLSRLRCTDYILDIDPENFTHYDAPTVSELAKHFESNWLYFRIKSNEAVVLNRTTPPCWASEKDVIESKSITDISMQDALATLWLKIKGNAE